MKRHTWIWNTVIFCALALPLSMTASLQWGVQNACAAQTDTYSQDQPVTAKPAKKKRAHAGRKNTVKKDGAEKKAPARMGRKFKKKNAVAPAPAAEPAPAVSQ